LKFFKDLLIYSVPFALIVGSNYNLNSLIGINISFGYIEFIILLMLLYISVNGKFFSPTNLLRAYLFGLFSFLLSLFFSSNSISTISIIELVRWIEYFLLFVCTYSLVDKDNVKKSLFVLIIPTILFIGVSVFQAFTFNFYEKRIYGTFLSSADLANESISNPNVAGAFLTGSFLLFYSFNNLNYGIKKYVLIMLQYISFILVLFTLSRSAFLGAVLGLLVLIILFKRSLIWYLLKISFFVSLLFSFFYYYIPKYDDIVIYQRAISTFDTSTVAGASVTARIDNSSRILDIAFDNFIFGIGFGDLENQFNLVPDNFYIHIFAETGIVGFLISVYMLIVIFYDLFIMFKTNSSDKLFFYFLAGFISVFITFLIENYAANLFRSPRLLGLFWYLLALIYKYNSITKKEQYKFNG
jgi:hypothetical protein